MRRFMFMVPAIMGGLVGSVKAATYTYLVDFGATNGPVASGYNAAQVAFNTVASPAFDLAGTSVSDPHITLSFTSVNNYDLGNANNPLVSGGLFVNSTGSGEGNFTISGLSSGESVSLYAINGWDGKGRAAFVSLNGGGYVDSGNHTNNLNADYTSGSGMPGTSPTIGDFALVGAGVNVPSSSLSGNFTYSDGVTTRAEGQLGGMIITVTTAVPEPTALGLMGMASVLLVRRRRGC